MYIEIEPREEEELKNGLKKRNDFEAKRLSRFLDYPDLTRDKNSPLFELVRRKPILVLICLISPPTIPAGAVPTLITLTTTTFCEPTPR
ncbi:MAG: hypothetical protein UU85_C0007G0011 [Candidatus Wolfebacteria bacterium GW2011_GWA2_42_10]|uniref:Uncharacterized protein n=1 Tax=Candidatus Wolfebacteria bacterium GW2011_GWA2_42_10 TaxID=1619004 RepID=A0A0G0ZSZ3_9BACT|nr:MAG: hypothetical protein UU85_C0007G0011 [Candidatus Wolfebacteria bacterium GW2011_GWA2_42_10]